jgi:hypothetical protein
MPSSSQALRAVREQPGPERRIDPGARHDLGAQRRRARVDHLDLAADLVGPIDPFSTSSSRTAVSMMS